MRVVAALGVSCVPCGGDESQTFCLSVWVDNIAAAYVDGGTLVPIDDAAIDANPACAE